MSKTANVECVMSRGFSMSSIHADFQRREHQLLHPEAEAARIARYQPTFDPVNNLTTLQQAALMQMHESHVNRAIYKTLLEDSQDKPGASAYAVLRQHGLARYMHGKRLHELTPEGSAAAKTLEQKLCQRFDLHLMIDKGHVGWEHKYACPCGQWSTMVRRSTTSDGNARRSFNRHIATAEGMQKLVVALKPPGMRVEG